MDYIEMLKEMLLFVRTDMEYNARPYKTKLDEGVEIFEEDLKILLHVYDMDVKPEELPTAEEVKELYYQYDEDVNKKLYKFYSWYTHYDFYIHHIYRLAMNIGNSHYLKKHGEPLIKKDWDHFTLEDFLKLEEYIKENPDFSQTDNDYRRLLKWLDVERPAETPQAQTP